MLQTDELIDTIIELDCLLSLVGVNYAIHVSFIYWMMMFDVQIKLI